MSVSCTVITIEIKGKKTKAIIAKTFPVRILQNLYETMVEYGKFCCETYNGA